MEKEYFVITFIDGEQCNRVMNIRELAELWQNDDICGCYDGIIAYKYNTVSHQLEEVNVYDLAQNYLKRQREIEDEYRDYCETVREYGYDYYDNF